MKIPSGFYRVSIKALIIDETHRKFLVTLEDNGFWELPGGGLEWGESHETCLKREIKEEMGLTVTKIAKYPSYYIAGKNMKDHWSLGLVFEVQVADMNFTKSDECQDIKFISPEEIDTLNAFRTVKDLAIQFDFTKHSNSNEFQNIF